MTTMLSVIAALFLKLDKPKLNRLKDHYSKTMSIVKSLDQMNIQGMVHNDDKAFDEELDVESNKKNDLKTSKKDGKTKKTKKQGGDKERSGKSRYSTFVNIPKANVAIFVGIVA